MELIFGIIGAASGVVSLAAIIYFLGVWRGQVDKDRAYFSDCLKLYPPGEMWTMVKTLWDIYVVDALRNRPDLAEHGSSYKLKKEGEDLIPDHLKDLLDRLPRNPFNREAIATGYLVVKHIGLDLISKMAEEKQLSVQEAIAVLSTYLETNENSH